MKKIALMLVVLSVFLAGCESLRFAPTETQKQNVWLHNKTAAIIAQQAKLEDSSEQLQNLSQLSEVQSRAITAYYGLPKEYPAAQTTEELFSQSNFGLAQQAMSDSSHRPDGFKMAENAMDILIGVCALFGGVYGTRAVQLLRAAKTKSLALKEVVLGNELFMHENAESKTNFKKAHRNQSPETRKMVSEVKIL